jgi:hypothetical protein
VEKTQYSLKKMWLGRTDHKPLARNDLRRAGRAGRDVSPYDVCTYNNLANDMPMRKKMMKSFVKFS